MHWLRFWFFTLDCFQDSILALCPPASLPPTCFLLSDPGITFLQRRSSYVVALPKTPRFQLYEIKLKLLRKRSMALKALLDPTPAVRNHPLYSQLPQHKHTPATRPHQSAGCFPNTPTPFHTPGLASSPAHLSTSVNAIPFSFCLAKFHLYFKGLPLVYFPLFGGFLNCLPTSCAWLILIPAIVVL